MLSVGSDILLVPQTLLAVAVQVYEVPLVRPVITNSGVLLVLAKVSMPSVQLPAYSVASDAPSSLTETTIWMMPSPDSSESNSVHLSRAESKIV